VCFSHGELFIIKVEKLGITIHSIERVGFFLYLKQNLDLNSTDMFVDIAIHFSIG
jgi:hypothetical protein